MGYGIKCIGVLYVRYGKVIYVMWTLKKAGRFWANLRKLSQTLGDAKIRIRQWFLFYVNVLAIL